METEDLLEQQLLDVLAANLRVARAARGLKQEDMADLVGLNRNYLGGIERGERNITLGSLAKLAHALGYAPHELLRPHDFAGESKNL